MNDSSKLIWVAVTAILVIGGATLLFVDRQPVEDPGRGPEPVVATPSQGSTTAKPKQRVFPAYRPSPSGKRRFAPQKRVRFKLTQADRDEWERVRSSDLAGAQHLLPNLSTEQIEAVLEANDRNTSFLLAAARFSKNDDYLFEAAENDPHNPEVQAAILDGWLFKDDPPPEVEGWIEALRQSAPDNPIGDYYAAYYALKKGDKDETRMAVERAQGKDAFDDFTAVRVTNSMAFLRQAGTPEIGMALSLYSTLLPHLGPLREVNKEMIAESKSEAEAGRTKEAEHYAQLADQIGSSMSQATHLFLINELVGIAVGLAALDNQKKLAGDTVDPQLIGRHEELMNRRLEIKDVAGLLDPQKMTLDQVINHTHNTMDYGELEALRLLEKELR
jgi:hypothetical protein